MAKADKLIEQVGDFGPFQKKIVTFGSFPCIFFAFVLVGVVFLGNTPDHWCLSPGTERLQEECGWTEVEVRDATVPRAEESGSFSRCERFVVDWNKSQNKCVEIDWWLTSNETQAVRCDSGWVFEDGHRTIVSEVGQFYSTNINSVRSFFIYKPPSLDIYLQTEDINHLVVQHDPRSPTVKTNSSKQCYSEISDRNPLLTRTFI